MTILLDPRVGSGELLPYFKPYDVEVTVESLSFGDAAWWGCGPDGYCLIGVERKVIADMISSMRSDRLSGFQLPGLLETYAYTYLIVEGIWRANPDGYIEVISHNGWIPVRVGPRSVMYRELDHYLATLEHVCGLTVAMTTDPQRTAAWIVSRYKWWEKEWDKHDSYRSIYAPGPPNEHGHSRRGSLSPMPKPGPVELVASQIPGVDKKAWAFGRVFKTVRDLVTATPERLEDVDGIGKKGADRIYRWLNHGDLK